MDERTTAPTNGHISRSGHHGAWHGAWNRYGLGKWLRSHVHNRRERSLTTTRVPTLAPLASQIIWAQGARAGDVGSGDPRSSAFTRPMACPLGERKRRTRHPVTSKPLRPVEKFGLPRSKEQRAPLLLPNLGRRSGVTDGRTHGHTNRKLAPPAKRGCGKYGRTRYFNAGG